MKILRWKYVLPRLAILYALYLTIHFGLDPLLKWAVISGGEAAVGARVELAELRTTLTEGELVVEGLAIANPRSPLRNVLEATDARLQLDMNALLHGRVVVEDGTVRGLQFDTDRETSGAIVKNESDEETNTSVLDPWLASANDMSQQWLDELGDRLSADLVDQLQTPKLAKELQVRWPEQYEKLQAQVKDIRNRGKELQAQIREVKKNPLRGIQRLTELQQQLAQLQQQIKSTQQQIGALPAQAEADRQKVFAARKQDEQFLRQQLQIGSLDGEGLTQTLLGKPVSEGLASALGWIGWAREQIPANSAKSKKLRGRGSTVLFTSPQPDYLIRRLQLEGAAQLGGKPLPWVGTLTDVSSSPKLLSEPTRLTLKGSEALELDAEIIIDRRSEVALDELLMACPQLAIEERTLGNAEKLAIELGAGKAKFELELKLNGDQLTGEIVFTQDSLSLTPRLAKSSNKQMSEVLQQALAGVKQLEATVTLAGTLKNPQVKIDSDIGSQVAAGLNSSVQQLLKQRTESLLAKSREQVDAQLQKLTQLREQAQQELLGQLGEGQELLKQLAGLSGGSAESPGSISRLGKSLRLDGLRK